MNKSHRRTRKSEKGKREARESEWQNGAKEKKTKADKYTKIKLERKREKATGSDSLHCKESNRLPVTC